MPVATPSLGGGGRRVGDDTARVPFPELAVSGFFLLLAMAFLGTALFARASPSLAHLFFYLGGYALIMTAGFLAAFLTVRARHAGPPARRTAILRNGKPLPMPLQKLRELTDRWWVWFANMDWLGGWLPVVSGFLLSLAALYALSRGWRGPAPASTATFNQLAGGLLLGAAFPLLVLERRYAGIAEVVLPEARALANLCRVPLLGVLALGLAAGLRWLNLPFAVTVEKIAAAIAGLVALELALRNIIYVFVPLPSLAARRSASVSVIAGLIQARMPDIRRFNASVRSQFGIDLARSWSLGFIRRAMPLLLLGIVLFSWLLTGVTALGLEQRAVYESFGRPKSVLHPGLHVHLPWPFGVLRPMEFGQVRSVAIDVGGDTEKADAAAAPAVAIEGEAPAAADRLWDSSRQEVGYLVASLSNGRQSFEAINIDMSIVYRIGLSDQAAIDAAYNVDAPGEMVKSIAQQILAHYFARNTLREVLGQNREAYVRRFQGELQSRLAALSTGIEVMTVVVEGIHPPPKVAASYQAVQAAAIDSHIKVNTATAEAAREMKMAALVANATRNDALSAAAERLSKARVDSIQFEGERQAHAAGGPSFLLERRLSRVARGLADKPLIIMDHRIPASAAPSFDMRQTRAPRSSFGDPSAD